MKKILAIICLLVLAGCGQKIVLLPDLDGHVGQVTVTAKSGETVVLDQANQALSGKDSVSTLTDEEVRSTFGAAMDAQPEPTAKFILYFKSDSTTLNGDSLKLFPDIMKAYEARKSTDVSVIGHSDALGDKQYNYQLSVRRAEKVKKMLVDKGMDEGIIQTISHGEENPLIPTPDGKSEPRNRRVEVRIR